MARLRDKEPDLAEFIPCRSPSALRKARGAPQYHRMSLSFHVYQRQPITWPYSKFGAANMKMVEHKQRDALPRTEIRKLKNPAPYSRVLVPSLPWINLAILRSNKIWI